MRERQNIWYTLARLRRQRPAVHVRARRVLVIMVAMALYLPAVGISILALISGSHWWGVDARPTGEQTGAWVVTWSDRGLSTDYNIQAGDKILAVDGHIPQSQDEINQATTLQVLSPEQSTSRMVAWKAPNQFDNLLSISWIILGTVSLLLGLLVFLHATDRTLALRFFLLWTALAIASALVPATSFGNLFAVHVSNSLYIGLAGGLLANFLWLLLFPSAPSVRKTESSQLPSEGPLHRSRHRWLPEIPVVTGILAAALYLIVLNLKQPELLQQATLPVSVQTAIALCLSIFFVLRASLSRQATVTRERARTLLGGMILGLTPLLALTIIPQSLTDQPLIPGTITTLAVIALPLSFAYAIVRRDLLRLDSLIRNTVLALLTTIGMAVAAVFLAELLSPLPTVPALVLGVIAGALLAPLVLNAARWITEAWLFPQVRRYRKLIASGESIERSVLTPERLAGQLVGEVHLALPVRQVAVFAPDKSTGQLVALSGAPASAKTEERAGGPTVAKTSSPLQSAPEQPIHYQPLLLDDVASARLSRAGGPILIAPAPESAAGEAFGSAQGSEPLDADTEHWRLLIPMRVHGRLVGVLALAHREDEQDYSDTDLQLLRFLAGRRALALDYSLLYADLHAAYEQRRELDAAKDRFIVTAHHELRTPLTGVQGYLELLRGLGPEGRDMRPKEVDIFIEHACQSADELSEQLDSLLRAAEMTFSQTQIRQQPVAVSAVAQHAMHSLEAQARRGNYRIRNQIPPDLLALADEEALYRIFMNLLSNALKYSAEGRPILFEAHPLETGTLPGRNGTAGEAGRAKAPMVRISVRDWGTGINPKDKYKIFERFTRLERELNSPVRGSGLGLAICKELVTAMGGTIDVISDGIPGAGSEFWFTLPLASTSAIARP
jgi:signal transduction histidine kinase